MPTTYFSARASDLGQNIHSCIQYDILKSHIGQHSPFITVHHHHWWTIMRLLTGKTRKKSLTRASSVGWPAKRNKLLRHACFTVQARWFNFLIHWSDQERKGKSRSGSSTTGIWWKKSFEMAGFRRFSYG